MVKPFPEIRQNRLSFGGVDRNPAVQLFGRRFFADQTVAELLIEMLLVATSPKNIGSEEISEDEIFPSLEVIKKWPKGESLKYAPKACLNLKLFAFLGASKLETRHKAHRQHFHDLLLKLRTSDQLIVTGSVDKNDVLRILENLLLGFQRIGATRTWCAQSFLPIVKELISGETLWNKTQALRDGVELWEQITSRFLHYFSFEKHRFLARGGELLYLQLCNAFRQPREKVQNWLKSIGLDDYLPPDEKNPVQLHFSLGKALKSIFDTAPKSIGNLAKFIDTGIEEETAKKTDYDTAGERRFTACGWCPEESWQEGFLFAIELLHLCQVAIDPVERIELLEIACALQLLRSLSAQSARYNDWLQKPLAMSLGYFWVISDPEGKDEVLKQISRRSVNILQKMIYDAIRNPEIRAVLEEQKRYDDLHSHSWDEKKIYKEADSRYGHKLFLSVAKRIGFLIPKRGAGARFVFNDPILRCMVLSLLSPGKRVTYDTFKDLLFLHYGIAIDEAKIINACKWSGISRLSTLGGDRDDWLISMLNAAGMLIELSDARSLVYNPFAKWGE